MILSKDIPRPLIYPWQRKCRLKFHRYVYITADAQTWKSRILEEWIETKCKQNLVQSRLQGLGKDEKTKKSNLLPLQATIPHNPDLEFGSTSKELCGHLTSYSFDFPVDKMRRERAPSSRSFWKGFLVGLVVRIPGLHCGGLDSTPGPGT